MKKLFCPECKKETLHKNKYEEWDCLDCLNTLRPLTKEELHEEQNWWKK